MAFKPPQAIRQNGTSIIVHQSIQAESKITLYIFLAPQKFAWRASTDHVGDIYSICECIRHKAHDSVGLRSYSL